MISVSVWREQSRVYSDAKVSTVNRTHVGNIQTAHLSICLFQFYFLYLLGFI
jgi:hypothetical protein